MHKFKFLSLLLLIGLIILVYILDYINDDQNTIKIVENRIIQPQISQVESEEETAIEKYMMEVQTYYYSDDQIINNAIISTLYDVCFEYFSDKNSFTKNTMSNIQIAQLHNYFNHCNEVNSTHPEFLIDNREAFYQNKKNTNPTGLLNLLVRNSLKLSKDYYQGVSVIKQINNENPNVLLVRNVKIALYDFYIEFYLLDLFNLLESQNQSYVTSIMMYAETLFACNRGAECGENSMELLLQCFGNERFCGVKSYQEFIGTKLTKSQQHDIYLTVEFIEDIFNKY